MAADVLFRMAQMDQIVPDMLAVIEEGLKRKSDLSLSQELSAPGDAAKVAKLLNMTTGGRDEQLLADIERKNSELAEQIKALMFVFEDLLLVEGKGVQRILREVDNKDLALALKAASDELKAHIRANMSERAGDALEEEMELLGPVRVKDVEAAQQRIMENVRQLEEAGDVVVQREGGSDDFIA
jgi:flagellar motor switch protein FliG